MNIKEELRREVDDFIRMHIATWGSVWLALLLIVQFGVPYGAAMLSTAILALFLYFLHPYRRIKAVIRDRNADGAHLPGFIRTRRKIGKER